jgi:hypothetical protein
MRPSRGEPWAGERWRQDKVGARLDDDEREVQRRQFDDPSAGPSHAPLAGAGGEFEDFHRQLEAVLQGVPKGMWTWI